MDDTMMGRIWEGFIIGVFSGVTVSIILWGKQAFDIWRDRRKEIKRLRGIIEYFREEIYSATDMDFQDRFISADVQRREKFDDMARQLNNAIDGGSKNLFYEETQKIKDELYLYTDLYPDVIPNLEAYNQIFGNLEGLTWLNLPPRTE